MGLKNKRILITAGPTWVRIDNVRVISNVSTGQTGILLAKKLIKRGARVTLLLGPVGSCCLNKNITVKNFKFFDELNDLLKNELKNKYDAVIQAAAVSDYKPMTTSKTKLSSKHKTLKLTLKPTPKIIDSLRKKSPRSFLAGFKFEPDLSGNKLINRSRSLLKKSRLDLVVANTIKNNHYAAYLVSAKEKYGPFPTKISMINNLIRHLKPGS